jgi:hypothetical protein
MGCRSEPRGLGESEFIVSSLGVSAELGRGFR